MIASRFSWSAGTLFSKENKKKSPWPPVSFPTSLQQLKKLTLRHIFNNRRYTLLIDIVEKKNEPVHHSRTRKPRKTDYGKIGTV